MLLFSVLLMEFGFDQPTENSAWGRSESETRVTLSTVSKKFQVVTI